MRGRMHATKVVAICIFVAQLAAKVAHAELYASTPEVKELTDKSFPLPSDTVHMVYVNVDEC